jgi:hypothetical protein
MICACCGNRIMTTAGCVECMSVTWCAYCSTRFCTNHRQEALSKHFERCSGIQKIGEIVIPTTSPMI